MERRVLILRTGGDSEHGWYGDMLSQLADLTVTVTRDQVVPPCGAVSYCLPPNTSWSPTLVTDQRNGVTGHDEDSLTCLATRVHEALDTCPSPSTCLLSVLWLCDTVPDQPCAPLYGALARAVSWHGASVTVVTKAQVSSPPSWLATLRAELMPQPYLCDCHGLREYVSPSLAWRGSLAFSDTELSHLRIPGYELHCTTDNVDTMMAPAAGTHGPMATRHMSCQLEVVCPVSVSSVLAQPQYLTGERLELRTPMMDEDDISAQFMTSGFEDGDSGYILKLKYSLDKPKTDPNLLKTDNWKKQIIECKFSEEAPEGHLGCDVHSINILVFDEDEKEDSDCSRATHKKTALVLKNVEDLGHLYNLRQSLSRQETNIDDIDSLVTGLRKFEFDSSNLTRLRNHIRKVQNKVVQILTECQHSMLTEYKLEDILIAVQEEIMKNVDNVIKANGNVNKDDIVSVAKSMESSQKKVNQNDNIEDWQEVRFLKYLSLYSEKEEQERVAAARMMKPNDEEYVLLEAKELIKYFDQNGLAAKSLEEVDVKLKNCPLRPQKGREEYEGLMSQHFDPIPDTDFSLKGFKFKEEKDFSVVEFTQYHDVYYNTGLASENHDLQSKNYRDCMVGPHRETKSTFSTNDNSSTRMKVISKKSSDQSIKASDKQPIQQRRSSPRKKVSQPLANIANNKKHSKMIATTKRQSLDKSDSKLNVSKGSDKGDSSSRRRSGHGQESWNGELSEVNRTKLRVAVSTALLGNKIKEDNPLFKKCFPKLFNICKMYLQDGPDE